MNSSNASRLPAVQFKFLRQVFGMPVRSKNTRPLADRLIQRSCQMINAEANNKVFRGEITPQQEAEQASSSPFDSNQHDAESEDPPSPATLMHDVFDAPSTPPPPAPGTLMYELFYAPLTPLPGEVALPETIVADNGMTSRSASPDFGDDANMAPASPDSDSDISYLFRSDPVPQPTTPQLSTTFPHPPSDEVADMDAVEQVALANPSSDMEEDEDLTLGYPPTPPPPFTRDDVPSDFDELASDWASAPASPARPVRSIQRKRSETSIDLERILSSPAAPLRPATASTPSLGSPFTLTTPARSSDREELETPPSPTTRFSSMRARIYVDGVEVPDDVSIFDRMSPGRNLPSPTVSEFENGNPYPRYRRVITYAKRDRERYLREQVKRGAAEASRAIDTAQLIGSGSGSWDDDDDDMGSRVDSESDSDNDMMEANSDEDAADAEANRDVEDAGEDMADAEDGMAGAEDEMTGMADAEDGMVGAEEGMADVEEDMVDADEADEMVESETTNTRNLNEQPIGRYLRRRGAASAISFPPMPIQIPYYESANLPRPLVDSENNLIALIAPGPKGLRKLWVDTIFDAGGYAHRAYHFGEFGHLGNGRSMLRAGIWHGVEAMEPYDLLEPQRRRGRNAPRDEVVVNENAPAVEVEAPKPGIHQIKISGPGVVEARQILSSPSYKLMSDYQNHLVHQSAERIFDFAKDKMDDILSTGLAVPAFEESIFTTAQLDFDIEPVAGLNRDAALGMMEAMTFLGDYNSRLGGYLIYNKDGARFEVPPGITVIFPSGFQEFTITPVRKNERRYIFRQFCSAGVHRWVDKGGRTDAEFTRDATLAEHAAWTNMRRSRGKDSAKLFSKLFEVVG
ncbi:hypothetical protein R3P38DRAFT_2811375 [Favolaschia claudopus]|uniref:Uncharacterized protein n=1 Tax=Favolaschia claudopus TaxID=2862362 RepID=A0AAV9Z914_9AGAR